MYSIAGLALQQISRDIAAELTVALPTKTGGGQMPVGDWALARGQTETTIKQRRKNYMKPDAPWSGRL
jgi:hypothetical protein